MYTQELEKIIKDSLEDYKLDGEEKYRFKVLSETLGEDQLRFVRNKAFELSRPYIELGGIDAINVLNWLDRVVKSIQPLNKKIRMTSEAYFSPGNSCRNRIINLIENAKKTIDICVFTISDNKITKRILESHERGIKVTIISDNDKANDKGSDIDYLLGKGIDVILDQTPYHMHHKFAIFDNKILLNGSFNWTRSASEVNEENILVTREVELVGQYGKQFESLKKSLK